MTPNGRDGLDDSQERRRYYPTLSERVTILEQKHKLQLKAMQNDMETMEAALRERLAELQEANATLQRTANELLIQVNELKVRSGLIGTVAGLITGGGVLLLDIVRQKVSGE